MEKQQQMALVEFGIDPDQIIHEDGRYWLTSEQLGIAMGYSDPRKGVMKVFERNRDELTPFSSVVKLTTEAGMREVTIFDTDGQLRIAMLANTKKAAKFREIVVNILRALERQEFIHISRVRDLQARLAEFEIREAVETSRVMTMVRYRQMKKYRSMGLTQRETGKLLDVSRDLVRKFERLERGFQFLPPGPRPSCRCEALPAEVING
ncbi:MAG: BRO family protein [Candidatus Marinimicrobia bacterium]|jgi:prophage antirepressor-like protein|nr:BRO family protein [Candidatus Neomarinimicrobiota bacterium]